MTAKNKHSINPDNYGIETSKAFYPGISLEPDKTVPFKYLKKKELSMLNGNRTKLVFGKGETIHKQGAHASNLFFIAAGLVKTYMEITSKNLIISILRAGSLTGLPALPAGSVYPYSSKALVNTVIYAYDITRIRSLMEQNPLFATSIAGITGEKLTAMYHRFFSLTQKQLHGRLADILLCLSEEIYRSTDFELFLSRKDLAGLTGMSTESTIRILKNFKDDRIINISGKRVKILQPEKLKRISITG